MKTLIALLLLLTGSVSAQDAIFNYPRIVSSTSGGSASSTVPGGSDRQIQFNDAGAFNGSTNLVLTATSGLVHGGTVSLTTASFIHKQGGTSSIDGITSESPNGLVTARLYADSTYAYLSRSGSAGGQIYVGATGIGLGTAPVTGVSLTVAGPVSVTILRTNGVVSGGTACLDGQETWSGVYKSKALCVGATWIILASTTTTVSNSGL